MALVTPPNHNVLQRANKENEQQQLDTPSSLLSTASKQRVVFSNRNQEHFFAPILPARDTPPSSQEPSKSILKKRSYDEFLADDIFPAQKTERSSTPEPENPPEQPAFLLSPIKTLVQSVAAGQFDDIGDVDIHDIIAAYCVLSTRIRSKLLPLPSGTDNKAAQQSHDETVQPALQPLVEYLDEITSAMIRDINRALEDPIKSSEHLPNETSTGLLSPPPSSPITEGSSPVDEADQPEEPPKKAGMNEQQVKHARDLCTVAQSAMKLLATLFCFTGLIKAQLLFTESQLSSLLGAVVSLPLASPLPTPNSRKTCALAVGLISSCNLSSKVLAQHSDGITAVFKRGLDGELGREGKKGSTSDALRGVLLFSAEHPHIFTAPFCAMLPSVLKILQGPSGALQTQAGFTIAALAYTTTEIGGASLGTSQVIEEYLTFKTKKKESQELQAPQILIVINKLFQALNAVFASKDADPSKAQANQSAQNMTHTGAMWALSVLSSLIVLADGVIFKNETLTFTIIKLIRLLLASKRVGVRTAASWTWRSFCWSIMREFNEIDADKPEERASLVKRTFDFLDKGVGVGIICALLVGSAGREDRDLRLDLAVETMSEMSRRRTNTSESMAVLSRLLATEEYEEPEGPVPGWDLNKFLPSVLFDGQLAEADAKTLLVLIKQQTSLEANWTEELSPLTPQECQDRLDSLFDVWIGGVKGHGLDDRGMINEEILEAWGMLLKHCSTPPTERVMFFLNERPHIWANLAEPSESRSQLIPHQIAQIRFVSSLWSKLMARFGRTPEMKHLAMEIYDKSLEIFDLEQGKVEDICLEMFFHLAEIDSSVAVLLMEHEEWDSNLKRSFWEKASGSTRDEQLIRALCTAPFGTPQPFDFGEDDWQRWETLWNTYMNEQETSATGRAELQVFFAEELSSSLSPSQACRIVFVLLQTLPLPIPASVDMNPVFSLVNQSFSLAYTSATHRILEMAITNLRLLTQALPMMQPTYLSALSPSLIQWIMEEQVHLSDDEYDLIMGTTYASVLDVIRRMPISIETLTAHSDLLSSITCRITPEMVTFKSFHTFWLAEYANKVDFEDVPEDVRTLVMINDTSSQEEPVVQNASSTVEDETIQADAESEPVEQDDLATASANLDELIKVASSVPVEVSLEEHDEAAPVDPLATAAPVGETPDEGEEISFHYLLQGPRWTGSFEDLSQHGTNDEDEAHPRYGVSASDHGDAFEYPPSSPVPSSPSTSEYSVRPLSRGSIFGLSSPSSPSSRKRRHLDDDEHATVKRRKQENDDSDDEDVNTPTRPWFDCQPDQSASCPPVPFGPFKKHNLPKNAYKFGVNEPASVPAHTKIASKYFDLKRLSQEARQDESRANYVESNLPEKGNPSSKRRRVGAVTSETPALHMAPHSDDIIPSSDDAKTEKLPGSDESLPASDGFSPEAIISPPMLSADAGSDDSHESPLKAHLDRKRKKEQKLRSGLNPARQILDQELRLAITKACSLVPDMDRSGLLQMSTLLEQMRSRVQEELQRK
ncbi:hypothetical protein CPB86DRAFT_778551 [Serendipita vermifera]|nr:hypothetical protein CPB86DRAFT_778551 [Serendipita vermifera]